jgi:hypothetical protein
MNIATLLCVVMLFCCVVIIIQQVYILLQWRGSLNDERYILQLECEVQYYRSLDVQHPQPLLEYWEGQDG